MRIVSAITFQLFLTMWTVRHIVLLGTVVAVDHSYRFTASLIELQLETKSLHRSQYFRGRDSCS